MTYLMIAVLLVAPMLMALLALSGLTPAALWLQVAGCAIFSLISFYFFHIIIFLISNLFCALARPKKNKDYLVVLGAALVENRVSPLLAKRVDAAMRFYHAQAARRSPPKLVMSGGQGSSKRLPEAHAMKNYALACGIPAGDILIEDQSANTWQNMAFSKALIERHWAGAGTGGQAPKIIFVSSGYHLLRSGMLAKKAGLHAKGLGGKTAPSYLPKALLREYTACVKMHLKPLLIMAVLALVGGGVLPLASHYILH